MSRLHSASGLFCYSKTLAKIKSPGAKRFLMANYKMMCACNKLAAAFLPVQSANNRYPLYFYSLNNSELYFIVK